MGYVAGETILDDEYNTFVNSSSDPFGYNHFAGTGATVYGLGQTHIDTVGAGATVEASNWNTLMTGITNLTGYPISLVRAIIETSVVILGWYFGGTVGLGTLIFAFGIGPSVALGLNIVNKF